MRTSAVETLLIGGSLDLATPPQVATKELLPYLPNGHQVVLPGIGHVQRFFAEQPEAGSRLVNTFFSSGQVDDSLYTPQRIDFPPGITLTAVAEVLAGLMIGLALIMVVLLLWMSYRVRQRNAFGGQSGAALRSVYLPVLGLGGWALSALVVVTLQMTVRLDSTVFAFVSMGTPVGVGAYWAWAHRDWSARTRTVGFVTAVGGALLGAWLGFNATPGFLALVTTMVGASVAANLGLIVVDLWRERSARKSLATATPPASFPVAGA